MVKSASHLKKAGEEMRSSVLCWQCDPGDVEHVFPVVEKLAVESTALPCPLQAHRTDNDLIKVGAVAVKQEKERRILVEQKVLCVRGRILGKARPQLRDQRLDSRQDVRVVRKRRVWLVHAHAPDGFSFNKVRPEGLTFIRNTLGQEGITITEMRYRA